MDYRKDCAETDEQREKENSFYGIGLTSRKNLCIHPEVSSLMSTQCSVRNVGDYLPALSVITFPGSAHTNSLIRSRKRRRVEWSMHDVETSPTPLCARKVARIQVLSNFVIGTRFVVIAADQAIANVLVESWET